MQDKLVLGSGYMFIVVLLLEMYSSHAGFLAIIMLLSLDGAAVLSWLSLAGLQRTANYCIQDTSISQHKRLKCCYIIDDVFLAGKSARQYCQVAS